MYTLKELRVNSGLDLIEVAGIIGVMPEILKNWENARAFPTVEQITRLEGLYHVTYADINFLPEDIGVTDTNDDVNEKINPVSKIEGNDHE